MTVIPDKAIQTDRKLWAWTLERYHHAIETGFLTENDRVELLFGNLIEQIPVGNLHAACLSKINSFFFRKYLDQYELRRENPIILSDESQPEPDFTIAALKCIYHSLGPPHITPVGPPVDNSHAAALRR